MDISLDQLRGTFKKLRASTHDGIEGVVRFAGSPGPTAVLTCLTHGNEPSGLAPLWYLWEHPEIVHDLKGTIFFCANNVEGAERFFQANTPDEKWAGRFCEVNMNRLPEDALENGDALELRRLRELMPVFLQADMGIDFHSFPDPGPCMTIDVKGDEARCSALFDPLGLPLRVTNMVEVQDGKPVVVTFRLLP